MAVALVSFLAACEQGSLDNSQVAARVNGDEISVHQLQMALTRSRGPEMAGDKRTATLERLIDRQLAVQQALSLALDRRPGVMMQLEEARRDILAAAYANELSAQLTPPMEQAVLPYYEQHPELFAQRKIYILREVVIAQDNAFLDEVQARLNRKEDLATVVSWLKSQKANHNDQVVAHAAEALPLEILPALAQVKPGDGIAFRLSRGLVAYQVLQAHGAALTLVQAKPMIMEHLRRQAEVQAVRVAVDKLKSAAGIDRPKASP